MASGQSQVSAETIEKTKQQIRGLVSEIAQLSKSDMAPEEFYAQFLQRVVQALAAVGGAVWTLGEGKKPQLSYQINLSEVLLDKESEDAQKHYRLLDYVVSTNSGQLVPPHSAHTDERMGGNPTRQLLVINPLGHDNQVEGLLEIFQRADTQPATQRGYLQFAKQMCELAGEWFKNRKLRDLGDRSSLWAQADQFARQVHESLEVRETCYTIVNEGRRLLGCDRVSIAVQRGGHCIVEAVSGQDTLDTRSNVVTMLGKLATRVCASGEPLWYAGNTEDMPPQIEKAIEDYVDQSYTKSLAVIPLRKAKAVDQAPNAAGMQTEQLAHTGEIIGALVIEQIESEIPREILAPRLDLVYEHSARGLSNSLEHNSLFLMPVWRMVGKSRWFVQARQLPKTVTITSLILLGILAGTLIPTNFDMRARGMLQPRIKHDAFAPMSGEVSDVLKDNGDTVEAGETLVIMRNPDLDIKRSQVEGEWKAAYEDASATNLQLNSGGGRKSLSEADRGQLESKLASARVRIKSLHEQLKLLDERKAKLIVKSPITGRVITWDAKKLLQNRPVDTGQVLMTIAAADTDYEVELYMPERRIEHMRKYRVKMKEAKPSDDLLVDFIVMTDPGVSHSGQVVHVNPTAEPHDEHGNMVRIRVKPDELLISPRPGATVTANVHCGRSSFLWAKLHEAWEWAEANLFF